MSKIWIRDGVYHEAIRTQVTLRSIILSTIQMHLQQAYGTVHFRTNSVDQLLNPSSEWSKALV